MKKAKAHTKSTITKKPRSNSRDGLGILNRHGDFWSATLFQTHEEAKAYFDGFWQSPGFARQKPKWSDYKVVPARSRITAIKPKKPYSARASS